MLITQGPTPPSAFLHRTSIYLGGVNCNINSYAPRTSSSSSSSSSKNLLGRCKPALTGLLAAAAVISSAAVGVAAMEAPPQPETLSNIPQTLSGECASPKDCQRARIQRPKSRKAESCTRKCVTTCIRGGEGSPGEGPLNVRRPLVVFKQGFRSRQYWLLDRSSLIDTNSSRMKKNPFSLIWFESYNNLYTRYASQKLQSRNYNQEAYNQGA